MYFMLLNQSAKMHKVQMLQAEKHLKRALTQQFCSVNAVLFQRDNKPQGI